MIKKCASVGEKQNKRTIILVHNRGFVIIMSGHSPRGVLSLFLMLPSDIRITEYQPTKRRV